MFGSRNKNNPPSEPPKDQPAPGPGEEPGDQHGEGGADGESFDALTARLQAELDDLDSRYRRTLADFQNYQRRALNNEADARTEGQRSVVRSVLTVLDHFDIALTQDPAKATAEQIITGVRVIRDELLRALQSHNVGFISPAANDEFDPMRHEAVMQQAQEGVEPGRIVRTLQSGYTLADRVLRPAKVIVSPRE